MRKEDTYTLLGTLSLVPRFKQMPPNHEKPQNKKGSYFRNYLIQRAENGTQTRDPQLGRLVLYRLSYFRKCIVPHTQAGLTMLFRSVMGGGINKF